MKHIIEKFNHWRAGCSRPGCMTSLEGMIVEDMSQESLDNFFQTDCPNVYMKDEETGYARQNVSEQERIEFIKKTAREKIKAWQSMIDYWDKL